VLLQGRGTADTAQHKAAVQGCWLQPRRLYHHVHEALTPSSKSCLSKGAVCSSRESPCLGHTISEAAILGAEWELFGANMSDSAHQWRNT